MEYAFDVKLKAVLRVQALSIQDAKKIIRLLDAVSTDELPCYGARLTEFSVDHSEALPFEINEIQS